MVLLLQCHFLLVFVIQCISSHCFLLRNRLLIPLPPILPQRLLPLHHLIILLQLQLDLMFSSPLGQLSLILHSLSSLLLLHLYPLQRHLLCLRFQFQLLCFLLHLRQFERFICVLRLIQVLRCLFIITLDLPLLLWTTLMSRSGSNPSFRS